MTSQTGKQITLPQEISRLIYLADTLRIPLPSPIAKQLFMGDLIALVSTKGYKAAITDLAIPENQLRQSMTDGAEAGPPDESEFRMLVCSQALEAMEGSLDQLGISKYLATMSIVSDFAKASKSDMIAFRRESMHGIVADEDFPKWNSGFAPLDMLTQGVYQGIILLLAKSGIGKTSTMLTLIESLAAQGNKSLWYVSTEVPMKMLKWRMTPILQRRELPAGFEIITGQLSPKQIYQMHMDEYDPERIIIHDSPDALGGGGSDGRRFALEDHYRDMVTLKEQCAAVFTVSQVRRKDRVLGMDSVAEAWAKAWYSDIIWTISRTGFFPDGTARMHSSVVKNRFGITDQQLQYGYDYANLVVDVTDSQPSFLGDGWDNQDPEDIDPTVEATRPERPTKKAKVQKAKAGSGEGW